jgi:hypothetical protein
MQDAHIPNGDALMDEVDVDLNMLGAVVLYRFGGEVDRIDVVTID